MEKSDEKELLINDIIDDVTLDAVVNNDKAIAVCDALSPLFETIEPDVQKFKNDYSFYSNLFAIVYDYLFEQQELLNKVYENTLKYAALEKADKGAV